MLENWSRQICPYCGGDITEQTHNSPSPINCPACGKKIYRDYGYKGLFPSWSKKDPSVIVLAILIAIVLILFSVKLVMYLLSQK